MKALRRRPKGDGQASVISCGNGVSNRRCNKLYAERFHWVMLAYGGATCPQFALEGACPSFFSNSGDHYAGKEKPYTTERHSFGELCWPWEKLSRPVVDTETPIRTSETTVTLNPFLCGPYLEFSAKRSSSLGQGGSGFSKRVVSKGWFWRMMLPRNETGTRVRSNAPPE